MPFDPLRRFLDADADPDEVRTANCALSARSAGPIRRSEAFFPVTGSDPRPERDGPFCPQLFGRVDDEGRAPWAHLDVPGVVHPGTVPVIAAALGWTAEALRAVLANEADVGEGGEVVPDAPPPEDPVAAVDAMLAAFDGNAARRAAGVHLVRRALEQRGADPAVVGLVPISAIPVPPPSERPRIPPAGGRSRAWQLGPVNASLVELIDAANRWRRLVELDAPPVVLAHEAAATQARFERFLGSFTGIAEEAWAPVTDPERLRLAVPPAAPIPEPCQRECALWIDTDRLLLSDGVRTAIVRATTGERLTELPTTWWRPHAVQDGLVVCVLDLDCGGFCEDEEHLGPYRPIAHRRIALWDVAGGRWLTEAPREVSIRVIENDEPEDLFVVDLASGARRRLRSGGDRPHLTAFDRTGRYALVGEGTSILDVQTLATMVDLGDANPDFGDIGDDEEGFGPGALALRGEDWWWLREDGLIGCNDLPVRMVGRPPWRAAGLDPDGVHLALVEDEEVRVERVDDGVETASWRR